MYKYIKAICHVFKNYRLYVIQILIYEIIYYFKFNNAFNKFKYLNSNFLSDSIPCPYFFLIKIKKFIGKKNFSYLCDLGSGYGKILYFFGKLNRYKIDGVELEKEIYLESTKLNDNKINIFNENILTFNIKKKKYDLLIINDPLKKNKDLIQLILKIKKKYKNIYFVFINLNQKKLNFIRNNLKVIKSFVISNSRNVLFCSVN